MGALSHFHRQIPPIAGSSRQPRQFGLECCWLDHAVAAINAAAIGKTAHLVSKEPHDSEVLAPGLPRGKYGSASHDE